MFAGLVVAVVVPAFTEEKHIVRVLSTMPTSGHRIVVVHDASEDDTGRHVRDVNDSRVVLLRHPENRGVGAAIATGYARAFADGADVAVVMAGDAQMDPRDLEPIVRPIARGEAEYVKGDRLSWPDA